MSERALGSEPPGSCTDVPMGIPAATGWEARAVSA